MEKLISISGALKPESWACISVGKAHVSATGSTAHDLRQELVRRISESEDFKGLGIVAVPVLSGQHIGLSSAEPFDLVLESGSGCVILEVELTNPLARFGWEHAMGWRHR